MKINNINDNIEELKAEVNGICTNLELLNKKKASLINLINELKTTEDIHVTDHAIIRYLERIEGVNIQEIKDKIVDEAVRQQYNTLGYGTYLNKSGTSRTVVRHNTAITVLPK